MKYCSLSVIDVSLKMAKHFSCVVILFLVAINCNKCDRINTDNQFLVTISGSNLTASEVLVKLKQLLTSLHGKASDIDECRLVMDICNLNATCINTLGSYKCACDVGHVRNGNLSGACLDIDECLLGIDNCSANAVCSNTPGSFTCMCVEGFTGNGVNCTDIDECLNSTESTCQTHEVCVNVPGSYRCSCESGYEQSSNCSDIDECQLGIHNCSSIETCENEQGSYSCTCNEGYVNIGTECMDVDECLIGDTADCHDKATCFNTQGSFECSCNDGYHGNGSFCLDVDECDNSPCLDNAQCVNSAGSYQCQCLLGFSESNSTCQDIDECKLGTHNCGNYSVCRNVPGSYSCECNAGYSGRGSECTDVDECTNDTNTNCHVKSICLNTPGSFACVCNDGYHGNGRLCTDVDECESNPCHNNSYCTNFAGTFECNCLTGFTEEDFSCIDIDECETFQDVCHHHSECQNIEGSYICQCLPGYNGNGSYCEDADECKENPCHHHGMCHNLIGSFTCECLDGFSGNGLTCEDVNECLKNTPCHQDATCLNSNGSFDCTCLDGYVGDGLNCTDIDECKDTDLCSINSHCVNENGSFSCNCNAGFTETNETCVDVDECSSGLTDCDPATQICVNTFGSFTCSCKQDMRWDGAECKTLSNECMTGTHDCHPLATCIHEGASYSCVCNDTSYDDNSKGRRCVSPVKVSCTPTKIFVEVVAEYYEMKQIFLRDLHLANDTCGGVLSSESDKHWIFEIDDLTSCGTTIRKNQTHVTYSNELSNAVKSGVFLGTFISVPFSCSYPSNLTVALPTPYLPQTNVISISGPNGTGTFVVEMHIYSDETYTSISNETEYATTDTLYVQVKLTADARKLVLLINECWATPTSSGSDPNAYSFIDNGCPIPGRVADTVRVTSNGGGKTAHFQTQVFGFVNFNTTYLHCTVDLCSQHGGHDCQKSCNRSRRSLPSLHRERRSSGAQFLSLGPFVTGRRNNLTSREDGFFIRHFATIVSGFVSAVLLMLCLVAYVLVSGHRLQLRLLRRFGTESSANHQDRVRSGSNATAIRTLHAVMSSSEPTTDKCYEHVGRGTSSFECSRV